MYIFNRSTLLDRHRMVEATTAAVEIAGTATEITGLPVSVFASRFGAPLNALRWSMRIESHAQLQDASDKLLANSDYLHWITTHADLFEEAPSDQLWSVVSSSLGGEPKRFYSLLAATAVTGRALEAVAYGVRTQEFVSNATGLPTAFARELHGAFGQVGWLTGADSMSDLDTLATLEATSADFHALVAEAGPLFLPGSGHGALLEKIN